ncbi:hypothetical protein AB1Y20_019012 [Prymnesium parvum]|uniref:Uncharacterized protein n=1 Tax=Prymnesium parvum TaxID=97485 RepID=A0AB34JTF8_PRYPA
MPPCECDGGGFLQLSEGYIDFSTTLVVEKQPGRCMSALLGGREALLGTGKEAHAERLCRGVTDGVTKLVNEPSLGLYYVMEHIQRSTPALIAKKQEIRRDGELLHGAHLDAAFALDELTLATSEDTLDTFQRMVALAKSAAGAAKSSRP